MSRGFALEENGLIVPYGTATVSSAQLAALAGNGLPGLSRPGAPVAAIAGQNTPLRMHDIAHPFTRPPQAQDLAHAETQVTFLQNHLEDLCGPWGAGLRAVVSAYFAAIRAQVETRTGELAARLGPIAGLAEPLHWAFSAPVPLPRSHLRLAGDTGVENFRTADLVFWDGSAIIAVFAGSGTPAGARKRAMDDLAAAGARVEHITQADLVSDALLDRLGPAFTDIARDEELPRSPFRGQGVPCPA